MRSAGLGPALSAGRTVPDRWSAAESGGGRPAVRPGCSPAAPAVRSWGPGDGCSATAPHSFRPSRAALRWSRWAWNSGVGSRTGVRRPSGSSPSGSRRPRAGPPSDRASEPESPPGGSGGGWPPAPSAVRSRTRSPEARSDRACGAVSSWSALTAAGLGVSGGFGGGGGGGASAGRSVDTRYLPGTGSRSAMCGTRSGTTRPAQARWRAPAKAAGPTPPASAITAVRRPLVPASPTDTSSCSRA